MLSQATNLFPVFILLIPMCIYIFLLGYPITHPDSRLGRLVSKSTTNWFIYAISTGLCLLFIYIVVLVLVLREVKIV